MKFTRCASTRIVTSNIFYCACPNKIQNSNFFEIKIKTIAQYGRTKELYGKDNNNIINYCIKKRKILILHQHL